MRLWIGWGCIAAAALVTAVWWPYMNVRMSKWSSDEPTAATVVRATVLGFTLAGAFILAGASRRRGEK